MTYSTTDRRIVLPEWVMPYLLEYGARFGCDNLSTIVERIVGDHKMAGLAALPFPSPVAPAAASQPAATPPAPGTASRFKL